MRTTTSGQMERPGRTRRLRAVRRPRLIRQASAWLPERDPEPLPLQDLEESEAIRWVDIYGGGLGRSEVLALLNPICRGELSERMARDLTTPERFAAGGRYRDERIAIASAFRIRHLQPAANGVEAASSNGGLTSVFEPVQLLTGDDWLISCWLPPRVFRGRGEATVDADDSPNGLYLAVAERWPTSDADCAADLAHLLRRELAVAAGYRPQAG